MKGKTCNLLTFILTFLIIITVSIVPAFADSKTAEPKINGASAVAYCVNTGEIIYEKDMNAQSDPFSTTKVMTAYLAIENLPLDKEITVSAEASYVGGSTMDLKEGEVLTVEQLLYGTMLPSGNDAAFTLAEAVSGDIKTFSELMNKTAKKMGCKNTKFTSPNGLTLTNNYTTAYDLLQISKVAFKNKTLRKIAGTKEYKVPKTNKSDKRTLKNGNDILFDDASVYSVKTGCWDSLHWAITVGAERKGLDIMVVIMGDSEKEIYNDSEKLLDYASATITGVKVKTKGYDTGRIDVKGGKEDTIGTCLADDAYAYLPKGYKESDILVKTEMKNDITAPIKAGDVVGEYQIYVENKQIGKVNIIAAESVEKKLITRQILSGIAMFIVVIIALLAVGKMKRR